MDADDILEIIWTSWEDSYQEWLPTFLSIIAHKEKMNELPEFDETALYEFMKGYHEWLAKELSNKGAITLNEVAAKVNGLLSS